MIFFDISTSCFMFYRICFFFYNLPQLFIRYLHQFMNLHNLWPRFDGPGTWGTWGAWGAGDPARDRAAVFSRDWAELRSSETKLPQLNKLLVRFLPSYNDPNRCNYPVFIWCTCICIQAQAEHRIFIWINFIKTWTSVSSMETETVKWAESKFKQQLQLFIYSQNINLNAANMQSNSRILIFIMRMKDCLNTKTDY